MKYAVDRIEDNIVILENIKTKELITEDISNLLKEIKEGTILQKNTNYKIVPSNRKKRIRIRFNKIKKLR